MAYHLSIFMENKPGRIDKITEILAKNNINIRGISVASGGEFGIVRVLVNDPDLAMDKLKENRITVSKRKIIASYIDDKEGSLHKFISILSQNDINIEDCYGIVIENKCKSIIIVEVEKYPEAEKVLIDNGIKVLTDKEIYCI